MTQNKIDHYNSLMKQDIEHRKLIRKLQAENSALKQRQTLPIDSVGNCLDFVPNAQGSNYCTVCEEHKRDH